VPHSVSFDLKQLIRVCLNDPDLEKEVKEALAEGPLPVRTPIANVSDDDVTFQSMLKSSREKSPGDAGFILRDNLGWVSGRLTEVIKTDHNASTISAEQVAEKLGVTVELLGGRKS
jgi:hypothetical protein